jgi:hypothetical protein
MHVDDYYLCEGLVPLVLWAIGYHLVPSSSKQLGHQALP